ncbi:MAG: DUF1844 domain-containing protein [Acidobacteria bacterium]|nr:DUF1844 domain-containing protein [Acidobacteriota bacterium]
MGDHGAPENRGGRGSGEIPLPGGGVLRTPAETEHDFGSTEVRFADVVQPFWLMALVALGVVPHPDSGQPQIDLARAREAIAVLELLRAKTSGHLDDAEQRLLDQALYELRMNYLGAQDRSGGA